MIFEKAFDKVEHHVILDMLHHKGFSDKWVSWIKAVLTTSSSAVSGGARNLRLGMPHIKKISKQIRNTMDDKL